MNPLRYDLAIIGSGFAGSLLALIARRLGLSVALLERGRHPRFAIGESSTPLTNLLLEELAVRYDLPQIRGLAKWGTWQQTHPDLAVGLKRGFTFLHHNFNEEWQPRDDRSNELLVAASPNDAVADTHWYRPDFDAYFVREAQAAGADYFDETLLTRVSFGSDGATLDADRRGGSRTFRAAWVVDASGPRGFLWQHLGLGESPFEGYPDTETLFAHFRDVRRWDDLHPTAAEPPYPYDDAALHHVFPGGWMWVLRFNQSVTSAGVSVQSSLARELNIGDAAEGWQRLLARLPSVAQQFRDATPTVAFQTQTPLAFRSARVAGDRWLLLPSAAGFVDPLLSTGFPLTLLGVQRCAEMLQADRGPTPERLAAYERATLGDLNVVAELIGALHINLGRPAIFQALLMLYFAAVSFAESLRRLDLRDQQPSFLLQDHQDFSSRLRQLCALSRTNGLDERQFSDSVAAAIEQIDIAGWSEPGRRNWHPVDLRELLTSCHKLGATPAQITTMLERSGLRITQPQNALNTH